MLGSLFALVDRGPTLTRLYVEYEWGSLGETEDPRARKWSLVRRVQFRAAYVGKAQQKERAQLAIVLGQRMSAFLPKGTDSYWLPEDSADRET